MRGYLAIASAIAIATAFVRNWVRGYLASAFAIAIATAFVRYATGSIEQP